MHSQCTGVTLRTKLSQDSQVSCVNKQPLNSFEAEKVQGKESIKPWKGGRKKSIYNTANTNKELFLHVDRRLSIV